MKIDHNLRIAIRSAQKAQPCDNWADRRKSEDEAIADFLKRNPFKARSVRSLMAAEKAGEKQAQESRQRLCERFGLRVNGDDKLEFGHFGRGKEAFAKAGGKIPKGGDARWSFYAVMAQVAAATPKEADAILKKHGIIWK